MISLDYVTEWRLSAPWTQDTQVEQDLILSRALVEMFSEGEIAAQLALRGGTGLYKLYLSPAPRYSEDIDLVQINQEPIGKLLDAIRDRLDPWLGTPRRIFKEGRVTLLYRMLSEGPQVLPLRLKIEINSREHFSVFDLEQQAFAIESRWFSGSASVKTYQLDELLGTKLRALYQRKKGRDLFDLWAARHKQVNPDRVVLCFRRYLNHDGLRVSQAEFERNLTGKTADPTFRQDIVPLLAPRVEWDFDEAMRFTRREFVARLP